MLTQRLRPQAGSDDDAAGGGGPVAPLAAARAGSHGGHPVGLLDAAALDRLRELDPKGKNRLLQRVAEAFHTSAARLLPQLHASVAAQDLNGVRHVAHTLKSSSASIGALRLSGLCAGLESQIRLDRVEDLPSQVEQIGNEIEVVLQALTLLMDAPA